jgi:hypothetical protein
MILKFNPETELYEAKKLLKSRIGQIIALSGKYTSSRDKQKKVATVNDERIHIYCVYPIFLCLF